jgi:phage tail-like protein
MSKHDGKHRRHSFRLSWDGKVVVGVDRVSPLVRLVEVITVRDGSSPGGSGHTVPGRIGTEPVTIERPAGADSAFEDWARSATDIASKKDVTIEVLDRDGGVLASYRLRRCWPSEYRVVLLGHRARAAAIEELRLENDGWEHLS